MMSRKRGANEVLNGDDEHNEDDGDNFEGGDDDEDGEEGDDNNDADDDDEDKVTRGQVNEKTVAKYQSLFHLLGKSLEDSFPEALDDNGSIQKPLFL